LIYQSIKWNFGGFPFWLKEKPGIVFRDYNKPFMDAMAAWMTNITNILR
jgi:hypothetical protein